MSADLVAHLALLGRALRARGVAVGLSDVADGAAALALVDLLDPGEVRSALRTALKVRRADWDAFDAVFREYWLQDEAAAGAAAAVPVQAPPLPRAGSGPSLPRAPGAAAPAAAWAEGDEPGYSPEALLRKKPFDECSAADLVAMERLLLRLARRLATRPSRRLVPTRGRGVLDLRRSFRRAVGTGGEFLELARRARAVEEPRLVVLCDTSGSMDPHTRFLLAFLLALTRVARRTEVFAFNTALTRLTPWLKPGNTALALQRLAAGVPDWAGGTRIGASLAEFVARHHDGSVDGRTVVVILSDGLDRGEPRVLVEAMRAIHARARRVIWLNPLLGDVRYRPLARGMEAALPFIDHFVPAHNIESLERLVPLLAA